MENNNNSNNNAAFIVARFGTDYAETGGKTIGDASIWLSVGAILRIQRAVWKATAARGRIKSLFLKDDVNNLFRLCPGSLSRCLH